MGRDKGRLFWEGQEGGGWGTCRKGGLQGAIKKEGWEGEVKKTKGIPVRARRAEK